MPEQQAWLSQYYGRWLSTASVNSDMIDEHNCIEVIAKPHMDAKAMQVDVFSIKDGQKQGILSELLVYDTVSEQIIALGQNDEGQSFIGKGKFQNRHRLTMLDKNIDGKPIMEVDFNFINPTEVILKGKALDTSTHDWEIKYIKQNNPIKEIGIQLVSVRELMLENLKETLNILGRMGFSYVETFVFDGNGFYGMSPLAFKNLVEECGLQFKGSMVFKDLPPVKEMNATMEWWQNCINKHQEAGVEFITTSNNRVHELKSEYDLKRLCDYYNTIGELCAAKDIQFAIHNHTEEFGRVDGHVIYDYLLQNTNPQFVSFQVDLYWIREAKQNAIDYFEKYPGRFFSWHTKDDAELSKSGKTDFEQLFQYAEQSGLKYNVFEIEQFNFHPFISINMGLNYLFEADFVQD